jgi:hypothetical protein
MTNKIVGFLIGNPLPSSSIVTDPLSLPLSMIGGTPEDGARGRET